MLKSAAQALAPRVQRVGIAADHGEFALFESLRAAGYEIEYGAFQLDRADDYPDFIIPLARAVAGRVERAVALCGSGVGASVATNRVSGVRAGLIHDVFPAITASRTTT
jgi:ribose 5-phosphate isomerase B